MKTSLSRHLLFAALMVLTATAAYAESTVVDRIVAVVNGEIITQYDLDEHMKPILDQLKGRQLSSQELDQLKAFQAKVLDQMVNDILLLQTAQGYDITVSDDDVDSYIKSVMEDQKWSQEDFDNYMVERGVAINDIKQKVREDIMRHRLLTSMVYSKIVVTDEDVKRAYEEQNGDLVASKVLHLRLIFLDSKGQAADLRKQIESGKLTFADAATQYSKGPGSDNGGDLGDLDWDDLAEDWQVALKDVPVGGMTAPFAVQGGEALLLVEEEKQGASMAFEEVKDGIYQRLMNKRKDEVLNEYLKEVRDRAVVENRL